MQKYSKRSIFEHNNVLQTDVAQLKSGTRRDVYNYIIMYTAKKVTFVDPNLCG